MADLGAPSLVLVPWDLTRSYGIADDGFFTAAVRWWAKTSMWPRAATSAALVRDYVHPDTLLAAAVRTRLAPALADLDVPAIERAPGSRLSYRIPVGLSRDERLRVEAFLLSRRPIPVPKRDVLALCDEAFPMRPDGWLAAFSGLLRYPSLRETLPQPRDLLAVSPNAVLGPLVDAYAPMLTDDALSLAGDMLATRDHEPSRLGVDEVHEVMTAAAVLAGGSLTLSADRIVLGLVEHHRHPGGSQARPSVS